MGGIRKGSLRTPAPESRDRFFTRVGGLRIPLLLEQAQIVQPDAMSWFQLAAAYASLDNWREAIEAYEKALAIDPDYAVAMFDLGGAHWNSGNGSGGLGNGDGAFPLSTNSAPSLSAISRSCLAIQLSANPAMALVRWEVSRWDHSRLMRFTVARSLASSLLFCVGRQKPRRGLSGRESRRSALLARHPASR